MGGLVVGNIRHLDLDQRVGMPRRLVVVRPPLKIIGLAGRMGSGKDTVAAMLRMRGFTRMAFADPLKAEVIAAVENRACPDQLRVDHPEIADIITAGAATRKSVTTRPYLEWMRVLLQWWGTEYRRTQDENYWVNLLDAAIGTNGFYAISDVRFENEAEYIRSRGGQVWVVKGRETHGGIEGHVSEVGVGLIKADHVIQNDGSIHDLACSVMATLGLAARREQ